MNEKDLKIIRYLAGVIFLALALSSFLYIYIHFSLLLHLPHIQPTVLLL